MFQNHLKIALRNLARNRGHSFINIAGLAIGMACCILILLFIQHELSYDRFHTQAPDIYRIALHGKIGDRTLDLATITAAVGPLMIEEFPEVQHTVRFKYPDKNIFRHGEKSFFEFAPLYVDSSFFKVFSFRLIKGDPGTALKAPFSMVITPDIATKYFGNADPIGKILTINNLHNFVVTGVIEKPPANSHFTFEILASFETLYRTLPQEVDGWIYWAYQTYFLLKPGTDYRALEAKFPAFIEKHVGKILRRIGAEHTWYLQPLTSIHLHSNLACELGVNRDVRYIYAFAAITLFILLIACINFVNLATARSIHRTKEVGIRKVLGSVRGRLILQFISESCLLTLISLVIASLIIWLALPFFKDLAGFSLNLKHLTAGWFIASVFLITFLVGVIASSYPACYLSRFQPIAVLKRNLTLNWKRQWSRSALVIFQFSISIALIISTMVIYQQLNYLRTKKLGFQPEQILVLSLWDEATRQHVNTIKSELISLADVTGVSGSDVVTGEPEYGVITCYPESLSQGFVMENLAVDRDFLDVYEIPVITGRGFSNIMGADQFEAALINETAWRALGWKNPIGKRITDHIDPAHPRNRTIIGVVRDFHHKTLHEAIAPTLIDYAPDFTSRLSIKISTANITRTLELIKQKWQTLAPEHPIDYFFLDDYFNHLYEAETRLSTIFRLFTLFAIFIACMGLFGLASFMAERRTKELGIRKVLGASLTSLLYLMNREFIKWLLIANLIAAPIAWFTMNRWLQQFAYRIDINWWIYILAGWITLLLAFMTVSYQAIQAVRANPVQSLRCE